MPIIFSQNRRAVDHKCHRARYWYTLFDGRGVVAKDEAQALTFGDVVHQAIATLHRGATPLDAVVAEVRSRLSLMPPGRSASEFLALGEGLVRGYHRAILPRLLQDYEVVLVEARTLYTYGDTILLSIPDLVLRRKSDRSLWYIEYKTTGDIGKKWFEQWEKSVQLMAGVKGVEEQIGEDVQGCIVQAFYKGRWDYKAQAQSSPFIYYWEKEGKRVPERPDKWAGWARVPVWEEIGSEAWGAEMPLASVVAQFPQTPPIFPNRGLMENWLRQSAIREQTISNVAQVLAHGIGGLSLSKGLREEMMDSVFPQDFNHCTPSWGYPCDYCDACWLPHVGRDPVGSGLYVWREKGPVEQEQEKLSA